MAGLAVLQMAFGYASGTGIKADGEVQMCGTG
jgi:hypothetical protein